jgi:hypothetical protein
MRALIRRGEQKLERVRRLILQGCSEAQSMCREKVSARLKDFPRGR